MGCLGLRLIGTVVWHRWQATLPQAFSIGAVGVAASLPMLRRSVCCWSVTIVRHHAFGLVLHAP